MTRQHLPILIATPLGRAPRCLVSWDQDSHVVSARVLREPAEPANLAGHINSALIQAQPERRLMVGDLDLLLDRQGLLTSLEIRVGPRASWHALALPPIFNAQGPVDIVFDTLFDHNGVAVVEASVMVGFDTTTSEFAFHIEGSTSTNYLRQADNIHVGTDAHGRLTAIRIGLAIGRSAHTQAESIDRPREPAEAANQDGISRRGWFRTRLVEQETLCAEQKSLRAKLCILAHKLLFLAQRSFFPWPQRRKPCMQAFEACAQSAEPWNARLRALPTK